MNINILKCEACPLKFMKLFSIYNIILMRIRETLQTLNLGFPKQAILPCQKSGIPLVLL